MRVALNKHLRYLEEVKLTIKNPEWIGKLIEILNNNFAIMVYLEQRVCHLTEPIEKWAKDVAYLEIVKNFDLDFANQISKIVQFPSNFHISSVNEHFLNGYFDYSTILNRNTKLNSDQLRKMNEVLDTTLENSEKYVSLIAKINI